MGTPLVPAEPVRAHLRGLLAAGMTQADITRASGASSTSINALLNGAYTPGRPEQASMQSLTADRLMSVTAEASQSRPSRAKLCSPGRSFTPVGYSVGRCHMCGQLAPVRRSGREMNVNLTAHPPLTDAPGPSAAPTAPPAAPAGVQCGGRPAQLPGDLTDALLRVCHAIVLQRPVGRIRYLAEVALRAAAVHEGQPAAVPGSARRAAAGKA